MEGNIILKTKRNKNMNLNFERAHQGFKQNQNFSLIELKS